MTKAKPSERLRRWTLALKYAHVVGRSIFRRRRKALPVSRSLLEQLVSDAYRIGYGDGVTIMLVGSRKFAGR